MPDEIRLWDDRTYSREMLEREFPELLAHAEEHSRLEDALDAQQFSWSALFRPVLKATLLSFAVMAAFVFCTPSLRASLQGSAIGAAAISLVLGGFWSMYLVAWWRGNAARPTRRIIIEGGWVKMYNAGTVTQLARVHDCKWRLGDVRNDTYWGACLPSRPAVILRLVPFRTSYWMNVACGVESDEAFNIWKSFMTVVTRSS